MTGRAVAGLPEEAIREGRRILPCPELSPGLYILEILHDGKRFTRKYLFNR
jgi:hypothetical protein